MNAILLRLIRSRVRYAGLLLIAASLACGLTETITPTPIIRQQITLPPEQVEPTREPSPLPEATPTAVFTLQQRAVQVFMGPELPPDPVNGSQALPFPEGFFVSTDASGEALLEGELEGQVCRIFVFLDTRLQKKACPRSTFESGNVSCVEEGTAVFDRCRNHLVSTPSGEAQLIGTRVAATYLPSQQASIYIVMEGEINVRARRISGQDSWTRARRVQAGQFYYTAPDDMLVDIPGAPAREPLSIDQLPAIMQVYPIAPWLDRLQTAGRGAEYPFPDPKLLTSATDLVIEVLPGRWESAYIKLAASLSDFVYTPVRVIVTNRGGLPSGPFKVALYGRSELGDFLRPFFVRGDPQTYYAFQDDGLGPGERVEFTGAVGFLSARVGERAQVYAEADSCAGEEFVPAECRIVEYAEENNRSEEMEVILQR